MGNFMNMGKRTDNKDNVTEEPRRTRRRSSDVLEAQPNEDASTATDDDGDDEDYVPPLAKKPRRDEDVNDAGDSELEESSVPPQRAMTRESNSTRRLIISEQNAAYEESLKADQEKERIKEEKREEDEAQKAKQERTLRKKKEVGENLPPEPNASEDGVFTLCVRLQNGTTIQRNFRSSDSLVILHQFVFSHEESPTEFIIVAYPNRILSSGGSGMGDAPANELTLSDVGIKRKEMLYVKEINEDENDKSS